MWTNYLKIAFRNMRRQPGYALINITGLALALAVCVLIGLFIYHEMSYNRFHEHSEQIFRVLKTVGQEDQKTTHALTPIPMAQQLAADYPQVGRAVRIDQEQGLISAGHQLIEERLLFVDSEFFQMFSFPLIHGNADRALDDPNSVVLSAEGARRVFGTTNVVGRSLTIDVIHGEEYQFTITGVTKPIPSNSSITFNVLLPISKMQAFSRPYKDPRMRGGAVTTYVQLVDPGQADELTAQLPAFLAQHLPEQIAQRTDLRLQPLSEVHFSPDLFGSLTPGTRHIYSYILAALGTFILLIAAVNFTTLSLGRSARRAGEVGTRKTLGARRGQLMMQFWGEAMLTTLSAAIMALLLAWGGLPFFNSLVGRELSVAVLANPMVGIAFVGFIVIVGLIAGSYPAAYLSHFQPAQVLTGTLTGRSKHGMMRGLVAGQFTLAILLIIGTILTTRQLELLQTKALGFDEEQVVRINVPKYRHGADLLRRYRAALQNEPRVTALSGSWEKIGGGDGVNFNRPHPATASGTEIEAYRFGVAPEIVEALGLTLTAGRSFSPGQEDEGSGVLVNEAFVRAAGWDNAPGRRVSARFSVKNAPIIGVVEDFHFQSLHHEVQPLLLHLSSPISTLYVRVTPGTPEAAIDVLRSRWQDVAPEQPFDYTFLDQQIQQQYQTERRWTRIITYAALFAIGIACMGLFGLAMLAANRRRKEIGIRKVLGASAAGIVGLLSKDFLKLVLIGFVIAAPVAYFGARHWLENFAYRIEIGPTVFIVAGLAAVAIAFLTVSYQAIKAALTNPADSLRYE